MAHTLETQISYNWVSMEGGDIPSIPSDEIMNHQIVNELSSYTHSSLPTNMASSLCILGKVQEERSKTQSCPDF